MNMKIPICMPVYNRPDYLNQVFSALCKCEGLDKYQIFISAEPNQPEVMKVINWVKNTGIIPITCVVNDVTKGCNENCRNAFQLGFDGTDSDFVVYVEDDIVLAKDALCFAEWAINEFKEDESFFSAGMYQQQRKGFVLNPLDIPKSFFRGALTPWGVAMPRKSFEKSRNWFTDNIHELNTTWDVKFSLHMADEMLYEVSPVISRSQNIGKVGFQSVGKTEGYGTEKFWEERQKVFSFISDVMPQYDAVKVFESFDPDLIDRFQRTYMRQRGIKNQELTPRSKKARDKYKYVFLDTGNGTVTQTTIEKIVPIVRSVKTNE